MPTLNVITNVPGNAVDNSDTMKSLSQTIARTVGKPERYVMISLTTDKPMLFAGTEEPCAFAELISVGALGGPKNPEISAAVAAVMQDKMGIRPDRFYLKFTDSGRNDFGWNSSTFA